MAVVSSYGGFFGTWIMNAGRRAGLFELLRDRGSATVDELAAALGYERRYVETWCRGAYAFELIGRGPEGAYALEPGVAEILLDPSDPRFMGGRAEFFPLLTTDFEMYPDRLADGGLYPFADRPPAVVRTMQAAARADAPNMIANVIPTEPELEARLRGGARILDAGCGAGYGLAAFADAYQQADIVGIEIDEASIEASRALVGGRARVEQIHVTEMPFRDEFDFAYANISLSHTWGATLEVVGAIRDALRPGGWFLASDVPFPSRLEDLRTPVGRMFVGVTVYVSLLGHSLLTSEELLDLFREAGFVDTRVVEQPSPTRMMILGRKGG